MQLRKKAILIIKWLLKIIIGFVLFVALYILSSFLLSLITINSNSKNTEELEVYILSNGVHTDIVVPTTTELYDWSKNIKYQDTKGLKSTKEYLAIGWGDKGFYLNTPTWADLSFRTAYRAALGLSTTAMHTTYINKPEVGEKCKRIMISKEQYQMLLDYMHAGFEQNKDGQFLLIETDANYNDSDAFYEAHGTYSIFRTCNTWTNSALKASEMRACFWTASDKGILRKYN